MFLFLKVVKLNLRLLILRETQKNVKGYHLYLYKQYKAHDPYLAYKPSEIKKHKMSKCVTNEARVVDNK